jgi:hypothetical protein
MATRKKAKKKPDPANLPSLVVEYKVPRGKEAASQKMRHALETWIDALLRKHKLGDCDGGSIGSGTMEVFCDVTDYASAKALVAKAIKATPYAGFSRIYKIAAEKPEPPAGKHSVYAPGDCLVVKLKGGKFTAAYVAASDVTMGCSHVVVELDYLEKTKPTLADFRKMKPLVITYGGSRDADGVIATSVTPRRTKKLDATFELAGNLPLKLRGVDIGLSRGAWVNWKAKLDRVTRAILKEYGASSDPAVGRYVGTSGDWFLGMDIVAQRRWDAKRRKR